MTILTTPRLLLRPFREGDAAELYDYAKDPRVGPIAGWPPHTSVENSLEIIRTVFSAPNVFAVADRESGRVIGSAGFVGEHRNELPSPDDELGYALSPAFWGQGLIPEASRALIRWGFTELGLETIWCNHYDGNARSRRVIEKCGFQYEGTIRQGFRRYDGQVFDDMCYSILKEEYFAHPQRFQPQAVKIPKDFEKEG